MPKVCLTGQLLKSTSKQLHYDFIFVNSTCTKFLFTRTKSVFSTLNSKKVPAILPGHEIFSGAAVTINSFYENRPRQKTD